LRAPTRLSGGQAREAERDALGGCRLELEALRLLLERLGRRETLKRKGAF